MVSRVGGDAPLDTAAVFLVPRWFVRLSTKEQIPGLGVIGLTIVRPSSNGGLQRIAQPVDGLRGRVFVRDASNDLPIDGNGSIKTSQEEQSSTSCPRLKKFGCRTLASRICPRIRGGGRLEARARQKTKDLRLTSPSASPSW